MQTAIEKEVNMEEAESKKNNSNEVVRPLSKLFLDNPPILQPRLPCAQRL